MRATRRITRAESSEAGREGPTLSLAPVFDSERAAGALSEFLEEARGILETIQESYLKGEEARPPELARRNMLRFLAGAHAEVEFHDLPSIPGLGIGRGRSLVQGMAGEGLVSVERNGTYPNMMYLRITPEGREELRRIAVNEAMAWMHGMNSEVSEAVGNARDALNGLVKMMAR